MRAANRELTFTGVIVVAPSEADESPTPEQKAVLGALHLRKIDLADRVLIVNPAATLESRRGVTPPEWSTRCESPRAHTVGEEDDHDEATPAHPRAGGPQAA